MSKSDSFIDEHSLASKSSGLDAVGLGWTRRHCGWLEVVLQHAQSRSRMDWHRGYLPSAQHNTPTPLIDALLRVPQPVVAEIDFVLALPAEMFLLTLC